MTFQPSPLSYGDDYGFLGLSKAERRDAKKRTAARKMATYKKCMDKGKGEAKCRKYKEKATKKLSRADELDEKLEGKGKGRSTKEREAAFGSKSKTRARSGAAKGKIGALRAGGAAGVGGGPGADEASMDEMEAMEASSSGGGLLLPIVGVLVLGGSVGFFLWRKNRS